MMAMKLLRTLLEFRLSEDSFDARLGQLACSFAGIAIIPVAAVAILKHAGSRADVLLGFGLACLVGLLLIVLGMLCRRNTELRGKVTPGSRWPEVASYFGCWGILVAGIGLLPDLGMSLAQITLSLLVTSSLSIAVLVLGMTTTLVRSLRG
jgi:hypothetical protein